MQMDQFLKRVGENIAKHRKLKPLNQMDAAEQAGFSYRYYQKIESGTANMTLATIYRIAQFLGIHPCDLMPSKIEN